MLKMLSEIGLMSPLCNQSPIENIGEICARRCVFGWKDVLSSISPNQALTFFLSPDPSRMQSDSISTVDLTGCAHEITGKQHAFVAGYRSSIPSGRLMQKSTSGMRSMMKTPSLGGSCCWSTKRGGWDSYHRQV